jgi:hypothetical protein
MSKAETHTSFLRAVVALALALTLLTSTGAEIARAADSWLAPGHDGADTNFNSGERSVSGVTVKSLHQVWQAKDIQRAIATDRQVFAINGGVAQPAALTVLEAHTGKVLHTYRASNLGFQSGEGIDDALYVGGRVVLAGAQTIVAVDPRTGHADWRVAGGATWLSAAGGVVYTGRACETACGLMLSLAIDARSGKILWRHAGNFGNRPVLIAGHVYQSWGMGTGRTKVFDSTSGALLGTLPVYARWTGDGTRAFADVTGAAASRSWLGEIGATGKPIWKIDLGHVAAVAADPVYAYGALYVASNRTSPGVSAVSAANGRLLWARDLGAGLALIAANHLLFVLHTRSGVLDILDAETGQTHRTLRVNGYSPAFTASPLFLSGDTLYVITGSGLIALRT